ncbi:IclR family transcriptional regulator [Paraburkholderia sp. J67]|uniref:IclR family transcriptional regulator n=1 Tax=Paraburkholderia sp. J67 TaxID=2805435 RepID=UPI002ABD3813|nr:IclR family transcriptional regulator [Paraburkholderia sp. J67]
MTDKTSDGVGNQGLERACSVLWALRKGGVQGLRLIDVARATDLSKATTHRLLASLVQAGLVEQDEETASFYLGFDLYVLGSGAINRFGIAEIAHESMKRIAQQTDDSAFLTVRAGYDAVCVDRVEGGFPIKVLTLDVGDRRPLGAGANGMALLASLPDEETQLVVANNGERFKNYPGLSASRVYEEIEATRRRGYAINNGGVIQGMSAVAVPILTMAGRPSHASIGIAAVTDRMQPERIATIAQWLQAEATRISERIAKMTEGMSEIATERLIASAAGRRVTG